MRRDRLERGGFLRRLFYGHRLVGHGRLHPLRPSARGAGRARVRGVSGASGADRCLGGGDPLWRHYPGDGAQAQIFAAGRTGPGDGPGDVAAIGGTCRRRCSSRSGPAASLAHLEAGIQSGWVAGGGYCAAIGNCVECRRPATNAGHAFAGNDDRAPTRATGARGVRCGREAGIGQDRNPGGRRSYDGKHAVRLCRSASTRRRGTGRGGGLDTRGALKRARALAQ